MARSEARLKFAIWRGLRGASAPAKLLYCVLLTDDSVNYAGVGRVCRELWAESAEMPLDKIDQCLTELVANGWVVVDGFSFLIRTMIRNDGVADQPNMLKAALREAQQVHSPKIRKVLAAELRKLPPKRPDTVKAGKVFAHPDPHAVADELDPPPPPPPPLNPPPPPKDSGVNGTLPEGSERVPDPWENHPENPSPEPSVGTLSLIPSADGSSEGISETPGGRGGGRGRGSSPVDINSTSVPPSAAQSATDSTATAQTLVGEWIELCRSRPPKPVIGQTSKVIKEMLAEGIAPDDIRAGISAWTAKGLHPAALPSVVNEVMNSSVVPFRGSSRNGYQSWSGPANESDYDQPMWPAEETL